MTTRARATANIIPTVDAKGDLLVGTASNALDNLTAGANGTYLRTNSSATTGLEWATLNVMPDDDQFILAGQVFG
jgi:hypothetical protein